MRRHRARRPRSRRRRGRRRPGGRHRLGHPLRCRRGGAGPADLLGTLFAQARRERPAAALVQDRVTAGALGVGAAAAPADGDDAHAPAVLLAELAALLAIVTQGVAVVTGVPLASVLDDLWIAFQPNS